MFNFSRIASFVVVSALLVANAVFVRCEFALDSKVGAGNLPNCDGCSMSSFTQAECLHLSNNDPCSGITCIQNTLFCPTCTPKPSVNNCVTTNKVIIYAQQSLSDQSCSTSDNGGFHQIHLGGACTDGCSGSFRCTTGSCSGTYYGTVNRQGSQPSC